jgi:O-antigen/teichoic acid export membrane protein
MCWNPVIDMITHGKYGAVNTSTILILSLCMPLLYLNNFLWTIFFVQNRLKMILHSFLITLSVNIAADLILIPIYKNEGAAIAFLLACLAQAIFYCSKNKITGLKHIFFRLMICTACAFFGGFIAKLLFQSVWLAGLASVIFYVAFLLVTMQIKLNDRKRISSILN